MPLTTAGLSGVEPADAGAASGLVNVTQQVGAALGLAVLVTVLSAAAGHAQLKAGAGVPTAPGARPRRDLRCRRASSASPRWSWWPSWSTCPDRPVEATRPSASSVAREAAAEEFELVDGEGFEWAGPELVA